MNIKRRDEKGKIEVHTPTDEMRQKVVELYEDGMTQKQVAAELSIDYKTLLKYYKEELEEGKRLLLNAVEGKAYRGALEGNPRLISLVLKSQGGWVETQKVENTGGSAVQIVFKNQTQLPSYLFPKQTEPEKTIELAPGIEVGKYEEEEEDDF